jgi:single-stranded DNA-binding protein
MEKSEIIGRLASDAELIQTEKSTFYAFSVYPINSGKDPNVWSVNLFFKKGAEIHSAIPSMLKKGNTVYLTGKPSINNYKNKEGENKAEFRLSTWEFEFVSTSKKDESETTKD